MIQKRNANERRSGDNIIQLLIIILNHYLKKVKCSINMIVARLSNNILTENIFIHSNISPRNNIICYFQFNYIKILLVGSIKIRIATIASN